MYELNISQIYDLLTQKKTVGSNSQRFFKNFYTKVRLELNNLLSSERFICFYSKEVSASRIVS